jgi:hypothetical protein
VQGIDPSTGLESGTVDGGSWMFMEGEELWVQKGAELVLVRVDPVTGASSNALRESRVQRGQGREHGLGFDEVGDVVQVDMDTGEVLGSVDVPEEPKQIVLAADSVWGHLRYRQARSSGSIPRHTRSSTPSDVGSDRSSWNWDSIRCGSATRQHELDRIIQQRARWCEDPRFASSPSLGCRSAAATCGRRHPARPGWRPSIRATIRSPTRSRWPGATYMDSYWLDGTLWVTTAFDQQLCRWTRQP